MSETTVPQGDAAPPPDSPGSRLVYCQLPGGSIIITTFNHCTIILGGTDIAKAPPPETSLIACTYNGSTIHTRASDCVSLGGTDLGEIS